MFQKFIVFLEVLSLITCCSSSLLMKTDPNLLPGSDIQNDVSYELLETGPHGGKLYKVLASSRYDDNVQLLDLTAASSYEQGYDAGYLTARASIYNYNAVLTTLLGKGNPQAILMNKFLDWQWQHYLSVQVPVEFMDELRGLTDGGYASGIKEDIGRIAARSVVIENFPGKLDNLQLIFEDEFQSSHPHIYPNPNNKSDTVDDTTSRRYGSGSAYQALKSSLEAADMDIDEVAAMIESVATRWHGVGCSMFGVWGSRTQDGQLFTGRNLDWEPQMGISKHKLVTVFHETKTNSNNTGVTYAHATVGWAGIWGSITGMSSRGLTVHEANLESDDITFRGFPWSLRLRYIMAHASTLDEALTLWNSTNNTVGFSHGIGSASDKMAVVMETMKGHTAVFSDNDPRETELYYQGENIGAPRLEAVYRTNHGYDLYTVEHFLWNGTNSYNYSIQRYMLFPEILDDYATGDVLIGVQEAVNITAIVSDKDNDHVYDCLGGEDGWNILSVTFEPSALNMFAAWENGVEENYLCASCNTYLKFDMSKWF